MIESCQLAADVKAQEYQQQQPIVRYSWYKSVLSWCHDWILSADDVKAQECQQLLLIHGWYSWYKYVLSWCYDWILSAGRWCKSPRISAAEANRQIQLIQNSPQLLPIHGWKYKFVLSWCHDWILSADDVKAQEYQQLQIRPIQNCAQLMPS